MADPSSPNELTARAQALADALASITDQIGREWREEFGVDNPPLAQQIAQAHADIAHDAAWRFAWLREQAPQARRVLDLASGYGTAVFHGLSQGFDMFGVEPSIAKHIIAANLLRGLSLPEYWRKRNLRAWGEALPFRDQSFDAILSYQTLEHVTDPRAVLAEWLRVTRSGGGIHLRCPDYSGTYEGHYLLPWLPLLPRSLARLWLRLRGRPEAGLQGITYVTATRVRRWLRSIAEQTPGLRLHIIDLEKKRFYAVLRQRRISSLPGLYWLYRCLRALKTAFRQEKPVHFWIAVEYRPKL